MHLLLQMEQLKRMQAELPRETDLAAVVNVQLVCESRIEQLTEELGRLQAQLDFKRQLITQVRSS